MRERGRAWKPPPKTAALARRCRRALEKRLKRYIKMQFELGYDKRFEAFTVPDKNVLAVLTPNKVEVTLTGEDEVRRALAEPIGTPRLGQIVKPGEKIAVITSDITRPMPTYKVMPALLDELCAAGVHKEDITLVFALGSHRAHTEEEMRRLAGERAFSEIRCVDSDPDDCVHLGETKRGTPVDITRIVAEADRRILLGNIEYHYFAGYSGGAKALMPGVSTPAAIQANHRMMVEPTSATGIIEGNNLRADLEEAARMCGADFILNVVLDEHKEIIRAVAGDMVEAHRVGCAFLDTLYAVKVPARADIVVVSQGGAPKDLNLYQVQKALDNAKHAVKDGGTIIVIGSCKEGMGNAVFADFMQSADTPQDVIDRLARGFKLGGHKAAAIALVLQRADITLVSEMDDDFVRSIFLKPAPSAAEAVEEALRKYGEGATVTVMPYGGSTLPRVDG